MELQDYLAVLRRNWLLISGTTVLGALLAGLFSMVSTPIYQASTQLFISMADESGSGGDSAYTGALFAQQRVKSYTAIVDSPSVLEPVIEELRLNTTPSLLAARVTAVAPANTVLITVTAKDTDPTQAALIANAVGSSFADEIVRLETPTGASSAPVKPSATRPAIEPTAPVSPRTKLNLLLGAMLGAMLGVGIALLRNILDTTVKTVEDITRASGSTVLGSVGFDAGAKAHPLVALTQGSASSEGFRSIRTNLQYVDIDQPPRTVVVTSSVPAEGKSTTACNLAITLAQAGSRVLLVEADLRRPRIADYLELDGAVGLTDLLIGKRSIDEVIVSWNRGLLDVLPSGPIPPNPSELLGSHQMAATIAELRSRYDVILLDAPPLLPVTDAAVLTGQADGAILIIRHGRTTREQLALATEALHQVGARLLGTVLNFVPQRARKDTYGYGYGSGHPYDEAPGRARLSEEAVFGATRRAQGSPRRAVAPSPAGVETDSDTPASVDDDPSPASPVEVESSAASKVWGEPRPPARG